MEKKINSLLIGWNLVLTAAVVFMAFKLMDRPVQQQESSSVPDTGEPTLVYVNTDTLLGNYPDHILVNSEIVSDTAPGELHMHVSTQNFRYMRLPIDYTMGIALYLDGTNFPIPNADDYIALFRVTIGEDHQLVIEEPVELTRFGD